MNLPHPWKKRIQHQACQHRQNGLLRTIEPRRSLDFASNDYLGLRLDPRLAEAAHRAAQEYGSGSGAARLLGGTTPLHEALEQQLAHWKQQEAALLFNTGYQANVSLIAALAKPGDRLFSDQLNHASIIDGCRLARAQGASLEVFAHLDREDLEAKIKAWRASAPSNALAMILTDAVFSMDGDLADLPALLELAQQYEALLVVDEAHASGLLGASGAGLAEAQRVAGQIPLLMGTLGKALGSFGAYVSGSRELVEHLINTCRGFIFSTALPPSVVGASLVGLQIAQMEPWRRERALAHARNLAKILQLPKPEAAILPIILAASNRAVTVSKRLMDLGFDVRAVRPPTVPEGTARLRITTGAHLETSDVEALAQALIQIEDDEP